jgi:hypothetical protein
VVTIKTYKVTLVSANIIDAVNNLWELSLIFDDDLGEVKKCEVRSKYVFNNNEIRRFRVTMKGKKIIKLEPVVRE